MSTEDDPLTPESRGLGPWYEEARRQVQKPGAALQWFGIVSLVLSVLWIVILLINPEAAFKPQYDWIVEFNRQQEPENRIKVPAFDQYVHDQTTQNLITSLVQMACSFVIFYGGVQMRSLHGYGWAIASAILAILPCNCCCCVGSIFGIWSLLVLLSADVRLSFARTPVG